MRTPIIVHVRRFRKRRLGNVWSILAAILEPRANLRCGLVVPVTVASTMKTGTLSNLACIPAGDFLMGASDSAADQRPVHRVYVSEFFIGRFPVTMEEYAQFVRDTGHPPPAIRDLPLIASGGRDTIFRELAVPYVWSGADPPSGYGAHPVVLVSYNDARAYCRWLSDTLRRTVRLPTEAEWEKAARGGLEGEPYPWGSNIDPSHANYLSEPGAKRRRGTCPTGAYAPNAYGLYDVAGNVWEWVSDWYSPDYYGASGDRDPEGPAEGQLRVLRGGGWVCDDVSMLRCAHRHTAPADTYAYSVGFRIVSSG